MNLRIYLLFLSVFCANLCLAQANQKATIDSSLQQLNQEINQCKQKEYCGWYSNDLIINSQENAWRGIGNYKEIFRFWYSEIPYHMDYFPKNGLEKIEILEDALPTYESHQTYFFKEGALCYFEYTYQNEDDEKEEYLFYFSNKKLVHYQEFRNSESGISSFQKQDWQTVLERSEKLQQLYLMAFEDFKR